MPQRAVDGFERIDDGKLSGNYSAPSFRIAKIKKPRMASNEHLLVFWILPHAMTTYSGFNVD